MITLNKEECENLIDALEEWHDVVGCKDCEIYRDDEMYDPDDDEQSCVGLDSDRYCELVAKLESCEDSMEKLKNEQPMKDIHSCEECGSVDVKVMDSAWFDPNNDLEFIEACEMTPTMKWCNNCNNETSLLIKENKQ